MAATVTVVNTSIATPKRLATTTTTTTTEPSTLPEPQQHQSRKLISDTVADLTPTPLPKKNSNNVFIDSLCRFILHLIHLGYLAFIIYKKLRTLLLDFYRHVVIAHNNDIEEFIRFDKAQLTKIPKHLSILISSELALERSLEDWETIVDDICRVSCWAWEFGIEELSVFDASGELKALGIDVYKRQSTMLHQWMNDKGKRGLKFSIISADDGRPSISRAAQNIARQKIPSEKIDIALVDEFVHECSDISDPELMLVYDALPHSYISLDGFPPWHIRLTEFINKGTSHRLDYWTLSSTLSKYSKVEQRFGR